MAKTTAPDPSTPTVQPGPAQGADPAVVIARPDADAQEQDAGALKQLQEDNGAGPRQEPIRRQAEPQGDPSAEDGPAKQPKAGEKGAPVNIVAMDGGSAHETAYNEQPEPVKPKKHGKTTDEDVDALATQLIKALETQSVTVGGDGYGRTYEFYTTTMNNQSVVMCVIKRDGLAQQIPVSTSTLTLRGPENEDIGLDNARDAVRALDGMLV